MCTCPSQTPSLPLPTILPPDNYMLILKVCESVSDNLSLRNNLIYLWFASSLLCGLFPICGTQASHCGGVSRWGAQALECVGSVAAALLECTGSISIVVAHRLSCSAAWGIFPGQGSNSCLLHWQADSSPLGHQGSPWPPCAFWKIFPRSPDHLDFYLGLISGAAHGFVGFLGKPLYGLAPPCP